MLAFAATAGRPAAVLTGPGVIAGPPPGVIRLPRPAGRGDMTRVGITGHPLTATAALVWNGGLPRAQQQILFDVADTATLPPVIPPSGPAKTEQHPAESASAATPALARCWN